MSNQINDLDLLIDITTGDLLRDTRSAITRAPLELVQGDVYRLRVMAVRPVRSNPLKLWEFVDLPSTLYVGVGPVGQTAQSGTFTLTFGANTTSAIAYNASAATVAAALNALASIISAGGVTVTGGAGGPYQVAFVSVGSRAAITGTLDALYPLCTLENYPLREGTGSLTEIQLLVIDRQPAALASTWSALPSAAVAIETLQGGASGVPEIQRVSINADAYDGTFTLAFGAATSAAIRFDATADELLAILEAMSTIGAGNIAVSGSSPEWTLTFQGTLTGNQAAITGSATGLKVPVGKLGSLDLRTGGIEQLVNGVSSVETILEVSALMSGTDPATIVQQTIILLNDGIPSAPGAPITLPTFLDETASDARYVQQSSTLIADAAITVGAALATTAATNSSPYGFTQTQADGLIARVNALIVDVTALKNKENTLLAQLRTMNILGT